MYKLRKCQRVLQHIYALYSKRWKSLATEDLKEMENDMESLSSALASKNREDADRLARSLEEGGKRCFRKTIWIHTKELLLALLFALIVATLVRQMWFEHYEVPTGSMRPTLEELDHLLVSKVDFSLNVPFEAKHLYMDPNQVKRLGIIVITVQNLDVSDPDDRYFYLFPVKKRFIKRLIAKPGDSLYFYGGLLYAVDNEGNALKELLDAPEIHKIEHIPFMTFEGRVSVGNPSSTGVYGLSALSQMGQEIALLKFNQARGDITGSLRGEWRDRVEELSEIYGMKNFAMSRLLTRSQAELYSNASLNHLPMADYYLELRHHANLDSSKLFWGTDRYGRFRPMLGMNTTLLPLDEKHLNTLMDTMFTSRFFVEGGKGARYDMNRPYFHQLTPEFPGVPNGCYELYYGKGYEVKWGGILSELNVNHPLLSHSSLNIQTLYNLGIEINGAFAPRGKGQTLFPARFAYFRDGDLYVLGSSVFKKDDPELQAFTQREKETSTHNPNYTPFIDEGPPLHEDGSFDVEKIRRYGLTLPDKMYLTLGDNHSVSSDSRVYGFVPENNLRGAPSLVIWPPGERWGLPQQARYDWVTIPRIIIWGVVIAIVVISVRSSRKKSASFRYKKLS